MAKLWKQKWVDYENPPHLLLVRWSLPAIYALGRGWESAYLPFQID